MGGGRGTVKKGEKKCTEPTGKSSLKEKLESLWWLKGELQLFWAIGRKQWKTSRLLPAPVLDLKFKFLWDKKARQISKMYSVVFQKNQSRVGRNAMSGVRKY